MNLNLTKLIGLMEQEAVYLIKAHRLTYRVTKRDGNAFIVTRDYKHDRVNLEFENGKITKASIG